MKVKSVMMVRVIGQPERQTLNEANEAVVSPPGRSNES